MRANQFVIVLDCPPRGFSRIQLQGHIPRAPCAESVKDWLCPMVYWSGHPVELVLYADAGPVAWFEQWGDVLSDVPARLHNIRFISTRPERDGRG